MAFSNEYASQCGYCTPGFIISGVSLINSGKVVNNDTINDAISGNLCRCTGYSPIIKAIKSVSDRKTKLKKVEIINKEKKVRLETLLI